MARQQRTECCQGFGVIHTPDCEHHPSRKRKSREDVLWSAMQMLADAGYYSVTIRATNPDSRVRVVVEGGAEAPKRNRKAGGT